MNLPNCQPMNFNTLPLKSYECPVKGLRKELIDFEFKTMIKPSELSRCLIQISDVKNLNSRESNYLTTNLSEFWIDLGTALSPIDYYIEIFLEQMFENETSKCFIQTRSSDVISFILKVEKIEFKGYLFQLKPKEIFDLATKYKENGVVMYKKNSKFAHEYFCRAAKCLISYQPFNVLNEKSDDVNPCKLEELLQNIQVNISACLLKEQRYENVIYLTKFVDQSSEVSEKAIYRRATAFYYLKKFEEAKSTIEKIENFRDKKDFLELYNKIISGWNNDNEKYKNIVKKMFA